MPHTITADRLIGRFEVPWRGVNQLARVDALPVDALRDARNVLTRRGVLRLRPGYSQFHSQVFTGTPTGITAYERGSNDPVPVLATTARLYKYDLGTFTDITGTLQTAVPTQPARFTTITIGTTNYVLHTNGKDAPMQWPGTTGNFVPIAGGPPAF